MDAQLEGWAQVTIKVRSATTQGNHQGEPVMSTASPVKASIFGPKSFRTGPEGQDIVFATQIITASEIRIDDEVWLPGESTASNRPHDVRSVKAVYGEFGGISHYEAMI